jgi:hypothetical protein
MVSNSRVLKEIVCGEGVGERIRDRELPKEQYKG